MDDDSGNQKIIIWLEKRGRKSNTYLKNWLDDEKELKQHNKNLKKKLGCNGSVKMKEIDNNKKLIFHLQGDRTYELTEYLKKEGINEDLIEVNN